MTSKNIYTPYFYIIRHISSGKMYAGSRYAKNCHPDEFMKIDGYTTSSTIINSIIREEGIQSFEVLRIDTYCDGCNAYDYETAFLDCLDCARSYEWFNGHNNKFTDMQHFGSEAFKQSMIDKYGVSNCMAIESIKIKQKTAERKTLMDRYGVDHNMKIPSTKEKLSNTRKELGLAKGENNPCYGLFGADHPASGKRSNETILLMQQNCGRWERTKEYCDAISIRQQKHSCFITNNPMNDPEKRKLVGASKLGRKKYFNGETNKSKYCIPGTEPPGYIMISKDKK